MVERIELWGGRARIGFAVVDMPIDADANRGAHANFRRLRNDDVIVTACRHKPKILAVVASAVAMRPMTMHAVIVSLSTG